MDKLVEFKEQNHKEIVKNLQKMDKEIIETVEKREIRKITNLEYGQPIFVRTQNSTKLNFEVSGVFYFMKYLSEKKDAILYYNP